MKKEEIKPVNQLTYQRAVNYYDDGHEALLVATFTLNDNFKNGHEDFSITGEGRVRYGPGNIGEFGGCCHEEIYKNFRELRPFIPLHLADFDGVPMYAIENGAFFAREGNANALANHLRIDLEKAKEIIDICKGDDELSKIVVPGEIEKLELAKRWKAEAKAAIVFLEETTGKKFKTKGKSHFKSDPERIKAYESFDLSKHGIETRRQERINTLKESRLDEANKKADKKITEIKQEAFLNGLLIQFGGSSDNVIIYQHRKEVVINWQHRDKGLAYSVAWPKETEGYLKTSFKSEEGKEHFEGYTVTYVTPQGELKRPPALL